MTDDQSNKTTKTQLLIHGYIEGVLSTKELSELRSLIVQDPNFADTFALAMEQHVLLDEHFSEAKATQSQVDSYFDLGALEHVPESSECQPVMVSRSLPRPVSPWYRSMMAVGGALLAASLLIAVFWKGGLETQASAAVSELNRIIAISSQTKDRTYQVTVDDASAEPRMFNRRPPPGKGQRPPQPPMDGAILHLRGGRQFVLIRKTYDGRLFVTGSNGQNSWLVRPDGPVRVSADLNRYRQGVPGQQLSVPMINIQDGLHGLLHDYDIQLKKVDSESSTMASFGEERQLLIAERKSASFLGPKRVEITYAVSTGQIQQMHFVEMPRAHERPLTLLLTLVEEREMGPDFFDHASHHEPQRAVELD